MHVTLARPAQLGDEELETWTGLLGRRGYASPFFHPAFTRLIGETRDDARVAVIRHQGELVGFLPLHVDRGRIARPIGLRLSDFHGPITEPVLSFDPEQFLSASGLSALHLDHLPGEPPGFDGWHLRVSSSPWIDLSAGFDAYADERREAGSRRLARIRQSARRLAREVGPLRFDPDDRSRLPLEQLLKWKSLQRRETGSFDVLDYPWVRELLRRLAHTREPGFAGRVATLYAGDELAAVHFGLESDRVLHYWFTAYNKNLQRHSPGLVLLVELLRWAAERGLERVDLGKGGEPYKQSLMSAADPIAKVAVDSRPLNASARKLAFWARKRWGETKLFSPARRLWRARLAGIMQDVG
jgi:CelD/BcsL family acetyltransferase involved in cellulose biosynthesis